MEQIKEATLQKAMVLLNAIGAVYAIVDTDGRRHGTLNLEPEKKRAKSKYAYGELTNYIKQHFGFLNVGDVCILPVGKYPIVDLRATLSSWLSKCHGKSTHTTCISEDRKSIQILRVE